MGLTGNTLKESDHSLGNVYSIHSCYSNMQVLWQSVDPPWEI